MGVGRMDGRTESSLLVEHIPSLPPPFLPSSHEPGKLQCNALNGPGVKDVWLKCGLNGPTNRCVVLRGAQEREGGRHSSGQNALII